MLGLRQAALVAHDLTPVVDDLKAVFGVEVAYRDPGVSTFGLHNAVIPVGSQFVEVVAPIRGDTAGGRYLERRHGDGGYMVILQCDDFPDRKARAEELNVRKVLEFDEGAHSFMQLHPRDTGGSFLEVDREGDGGDMNGPWAPAGRNWQAAQRTDVVTGISAAEIQAAEPATVAQRWADILDTTVSEHDDGSYTITLDNATLRFVTDQDGRGDGLGGLDIVAVDRDGLLAAAVERGFTADDGVLNIGGVRFRVLGDDA
jgi:hypothetical protein